LIIGDAKRVDYVLDSKVFNQTDNKPKSPLTVLKLLKMAREYEFLKSHNAINDREFLQKKISTQCSYSDFNVNLLEAFSNKDPNYLVLHFLVSNLSDDNILNLTEQNTKISYK
jgi:hypothetical protein